MSSKFPAPRFAMRFGKLLPILFLFAFAVTPHFASAAGTWAGTMSNIWGVSGNWNGGTPSATNAAIFYAPGAANLNITLSGGGNAASMTFGDNASANVTVNLTGGLLRLAASGSAAVTAGSTGTHAIMGPSNFVLGTSGLLGAVTENFAITNDSAKLFTIGANIQAPSQGAGSTITKNLIFGGSGNIVASGAFVVSDPTLETLNITKQGSGAVTLSSGASANNGAVIVNGGVLEVTVLANGGAVSSIGNSGTAASNLVLNGGTLRYLGSSGTTTNRLFTVGAGGGALDASGAASVSFSATNVVTLAGADFARTLTLTGTNAGNNILAASIGDNGSGKTGLTKSGVGKWVLTGASAYSGTTTIGAGTLTVASTNALAGTSRITVASGGLLQISASNSVNDLAAVTLSGGTILRDPGITEKFGDLTLTSASTINFGSGAVGKLTFGAYSPTWLLTVANFARGDSLVFSTDLTPIFSGNSSSYFDFGGHEITTGWNGSSFTITSVPEPSAIVAAALMLGVFLRPKKRYCSPFCDGPRKPSSLEGEIS